MKRICALQLMWLLVACQGDEPDAYGNFEAEEVTVSAEVGGVLKDFRAREGERIAAGAVVARIDPEPLQLRRDELAAQQATVGIRITEAEAQTDVLRVQLATAREEYARTLRLFHAEAATARQLNIAESDVRVLERRLAAAVAQAAAARSEASGAAARLRQLDRQIGVSSVTNPASGTVTTRFVRSGELVQPGQPLYRIAPLEEMTLRAYVTGAQVGRLRVQQSVKVRFDVGSDLATRDGTVRWISPRAEFTPTPIQTRDERADQVYAIEVQVANPDGAIKIGMPGELVLDP